MKSNQILQVIYSFFLGLVVVGFVGVGLNTFYPSPRYPDAGADPGYEAASRTWSLNTSMILVACATLILLLALWRAERQAVVANGLLLGGLFTMVYGVGMSIPAEKAIGRFAVITVALLVTIAVGYLKFARGHRPSVPAPPADTAEPDEALTARVAAVEARLDAVRKALQSE